MIKRVTHSTMFVKDQNETLRFYTEKLGFEVRADMTMGDFRWLTVGAKDQPDFDFVLFALRADNSFLSDEDIKAITHLLENGKLGGPVLQADDLQKTYEEMQAKGVEFVAPPTDQPWATEAIFKDNNGYIFSLQQDR
ncbi:MAG: VOC family protein [Chloroflexota bacterium]